MNRFVNQLLHIFQKNVVNYMIFQLSDV